MVLLINDPPRMDEDRDHMAARILDLTLEIIYWITGEDYTVMKKSSGESVTPRVSGGWSRTPSPITEPPPHSLIHEQKILELTTRITELLTGEVPIRCQDITVYFSMEEWEYIEGHKDLYKDVMMKDHQPLTSPDGSSQRNPPERCPSPLYSQDCPQEKPNVPVDYQENCDGQTSEHENPVSASMNGEDGMRDSNGYLLLSPYYEVEDNNTTQANAIIPDVPVVFHSRDLSHGTAGHPKSSSNPLLSGKQGPGHRRGNMFPCGKQFKKKSNLSFQERIPGDERPFSCPESGESFTGEFILDEHQRTHTGKKPFACSECGKCFMHKGSVGRHQRTHTGEKPYSCPECMKCFKYKSYLVEHLRIHLGVKPFSCSECGKCFSRKSNLMEHVRIHTRETLFSCSVCRKCFSKKSNLKKHLKVHTGEKPYSCPQCRKCFSEKSILVGHLRIHTGEKPFSCSDCGRCFSQKSGLLRHQTTHSEVKPF